MFNTNESKLSSLKTFKNKVEESCDKDSGTLADVNDKKSNETYGLADWELGNGV